MEIICIFFGILFISTGILFALGKIHIRISAWKNMPHEEKKKINITALVRNIGIVISVCDLIFLLRGIFPVFAGRPFIFLMIIWLISAGIDVRYISKSDRYRNK